MKTEQLTEDYLVGLYKDIVIIGDNVCNRLEIGHSTAYDIYFIPIVDDRLNLTVLVAITGVGSGIFEENNYYDPHYVAEKMNLPISDAERIAEVINYLLSNQTTEV